MYSVCGLNSIDTTVRDYLLEFINDILSVDTVYKRCGTLIELLNTIIMLQCRKTLGSFSTICVMLVTQ